MNGRMIEEKESRAFLLELKDSVLDVPDFPRKGILFKDITPILGNGRLFRGMIQTLADRYRVSKPDVIVCIESRGFFMGSPLAVELGVGLVPVRKKGKLPRPTKSVSYQLEYGWDSLEVHRDDLSEGMKVLVIDDVLATGGTMRAVLELLSEFRCEVQELSFLIELKALEGRKKLIGHPVYSLIQY